jgi:hypothetical protein
VRASAAVAVMAPSTLSLLGRPVTRDGSDKDGSFEGLGPRARDAL